MKKKQKPATRCKRMTGRAKKGVRSMPFTKFITILKGNQAEFGRFRRVAEDMLMLCALASLVWGVCYAVSYIFGLCGVA